jgi:DNA-binding transcriptional MerR regulator
VPKETPEGAPQKKLMKTGELARRAGVSRQVIASYCMYGLIREAARTPTGHRLFDEVALRRIRLIRDMLKQHDGYTIRDIREIFIKDR